MVKIAIGSDLHTEFERTFDNIPCVDPDTDMVIIAGDITTYARKGLRSTINRIRDMDSHIDMFVLMGNHDYYMGTIESTLAEAREIAESMTSVWVLENDTVERTYGDHTVSITGSTLWSSLNLGDMSLTDSEVERNIADFRAIYGFQACDMRKLNKQAELYIQARYSNMAYNARNKENVTHIVATHFMPTIEATNRGSYAGDRLNPYFCHELEYPEYKPDYHIFGHTHDRMEFEYNDIRYIANPRGYPGEIAEKWDWKYINV